MEWKITDGTVTSLPTEECEVVLFAPVAIANKASVKPMLSDNGACPISGSAVSYFYPDGPFGGKGPQFGSCVNRWADHASVIVENIEISALTPGIWYLVLPSLPEEAISW
jgi:hypothetical protein